MTAFSAWVGKHKALTALLSIVLVVVVFAAWLWFNTAQTKINVMQEGYGQEKSITALANTVQIDLGNCLDKSAQTAGITQQEYSSIGSILSKVVAARYTNANGQPTRASAVLGGGQFISALAEQYPQIDLSAWKTLMSVVNGCRDNVAGDQAHLQIMSADFQTWTQGGGVFWTHGWRGTFPNSKLVAVDPVTGQKRTGEAALGWLTQVISTSDAAKAIHTRTMPNQTLFPSPGSPAPASSAPSPSASH